LQNERVQERRVSPECVECDKNFAGAADERNYCPNATCQNTTPTCIKVAHGLVERFSALHERAPFRRLNETCDDDTDEAKHSQALRNVEPGDGNDRENGPDQSWTDKTGSTGSLDQQHKS